MRGTSMARAVITQPLSGVNPPSTWLMKPHLPTGYSLAMRATRLSSICAFQMAMAPALSITASVEWSRIRYCGGLANAADVDSRTAAASRGRMIMALGTS